MITLINPPGLKSFSGLQMHTPNPPIGLAYVAAAVRDAGYRYAVIDGTGLALDSVHPYPNRADLLMQGLSIDEILVRIPRETKIVGICCMFSTLWPLTRLLAERIRTQFRDVLLVLGGEHGTAVSHHVLKASPFDIVVAGEGEETFVNLLRAVDEGSSWHEIKGIVFREGEEIVDTGLSARQRDVDSIPWPDWDSFPIEEYIARHQVNGINLGRSMPLLATRGCPYQCTFCSNPGMWTQRYVPRNPRDVVNEMEHYVRKFNVTNFDFQDLTAIVKRRWAIEFSNELIARNLNITWQMPSGTRSEVFDRDISRLLYRSGCRALAFAPESGSTEILRVIKKQVDLDEVSKAARIALDEGFMVSCFFVIGFPTETAKTLRETMRLIRRLALAGIHDVSVSKFIPYPGSALFRHLQSTGKIQLDDQFFVSPMDYYTSNAPSYADAISSRKLYFTMIWMFTNFYVISFVCRPWRVARVLWNAISKGAEETRYAKWFVDNFYVRRHWRKLMQRSAG
jgi:anaerobic magnesium-protoporphyrin IX monomethyl ester cyclase